MLNVLTMRRKNLPRLHGKLVPLQNTENVFALAEGEVGPACDNKSIGSSAREVGPAANSVEVLGSAKREVGPAATPGDARPGSDDSIQHGCHPTTKPGKYGIISLFGGVSSVLRVLTQKVGCPPTAILLAAIQRQAQHAYTFPMSTNLLKMIAFYSVNLQLSFLVSNRLLLGGPLVRTSPMLDIYMVYWD